MLRPRRLIAASLSLAILFFAAGASAGNPGATTGELPQRSIGNNLVFGGPSATTDKVVVDTLLIMGPWGSGAPYNGQFETPEGAPSWNGWTSTDLTQPDVSHWHVDTYQVVSGTYSAWCGDSIFAACNDSLDIAGGYGNSWDEILEWRGAVANPAQPCTVSVNALVNHDTEPGYDFSFLSAVQGGATNDLWTADGKGVAAPIAVQTVYLPSDYEGTAGDEVVIRFRVTSDGGWSDEDCSYMSAGALQVDDVQISLSNGTGYSHDFEDGTLGDFHVVFPQGVGDFAKVWPNPGVLPSFESGNFSPVAAFIDDGLVVPGTGGTPCLTWCYGPGGYIVNNTGGLVGPSGHIHNAIRSPRMALPLPANEGNDLSFDVWRHLLLDAASPGIFFTWAVRTTADPDSLALDNAPWQDRNFIYYGGPDWFRMVNPVSDLTVAGARWAQIELAVYELGWVWGWNQTDGTPSPYFDNVRFTSFPFYGPSLSATVTALPHDNFPENGTLDLVNLAQNNVRFDMGQAANLYGEPPASTPGDSIVITVVPQRAGAVLVGSPRMHWRLQANALFTPAVRSAGLGTSGYVDGQPVSAGGSPFPDNFSFDLPDSGFLFPGDLLYYYFEATDSRGGEVQTVTLPADTTGFSNFGDPMAYPPIYKLHALPSLRAEAGPPVAIQQPTVLFWDDAGAVGNRDEWYSAWANLGLVAGTDYDIYYTNNPSVAAGHGLGGRATLNQISGYTDIVYTSGVQTANTLSSGWTQSPDDAGDDVGLLTSWLQLGGRDMLLTGDDLAGDLTRHSPATQAFCQNWMGVTLADENVLGLIGPQTEPLVEPENANPIVVSIGSWRAVATALSVGSGYYGSGNTVTGLKRYDAVTIQPGAQRLAQFLDPAGFPGAYGYSAATLNIRPDYSARVVSFPYDFQSIWTAAAGEVKSDAPLSARAQILGDILNYFGQPAGGSPSSVPGAGVFAVHAYPNPFNPQVTISYELPQREHLKVQVYDIRGRLVQTLTDGRQPAGPGQVLWDGRTADGGTAATGVYFYRLQAGEKERVGKIALIK